MLRVVGGHHAHQSVDPGLARAVGVVARGAAVLAGRRGRADDGPAAAREQRPEAVLADQEHPGEVDVDRALPDLEREPVGAVVLARELDARVRRRRCRGRRRPPTAVATAASTAASSRTSAGQREGRVAAAELGRDGIQRARVDVEQRDARALGARSAGRPPGPIPLPAPVMIARLPSMRPPAAVAGLLVMSPALPESSRRGSRGRRRASSLRRPRDPRR